MIMQCLLLTVSTATDSAGYLTLLHLAQEETAQNDACATAAQCNGNPTQAQLR